MLTVPDFAAEDAGAAFPQHRHAGAPNRGELGGTRRRHVALVALTGLARLATGKTCSACHRCCPALVRFGVCASSSVPSMPSKKNVIGTSSALLNS